MGGNISGGKYGCNSWFAARSGCSTRPPLDPLFHRGLSGDRRCAKRLTRVSHLRTLGVRFLVSPHDFTTATPHVTSSPLLSSSIITPPGRIYHLFMLNVPSTSSGVGVLYSVVDNHDCILVRVPLM